MLVSIKAGTVMVDAATLDQLQDARSGDATAFGALIAPLVHPAYQLAVGMLQDATEVEDVVQEACLTAWRKLGHLRAATSLRPLVPGNRRRSLPSHTAVVSVLEQADPVVTVTDAPDPSTVAADLRLAYRRLAHDELLVLTLHYCLDLPLDEVGTTLGISRQAAKSRLYRAVRKLRPMLEDPEEAGRASLPAEFHQELEILEEHPVRHAAGYVLDCFWSAFESLTSSDSYQETVTRAIKYGNDTDTTGAVASGLAGVYWGVGGTPAEWLRDMRGQEIVDPLIQRLLS